MGPDLRLPGAPSLVNDYSWQISVRVYAIFITGNSGYMLAQLFFLCLSWLTSQITFISLDDRELGCSMYLP